MKFSVLISTIDYGLENIILPDVNDTEYVIIHQLTGHNIPRLNIPEKLQRHDVKLYQYYGRGLAESRNKALSMASGEICVVADDDMKYEDQAFQFIEQVFERFPEADIITFKARHRDNTPFKQYSLRSFTHNWCTIWRVSSIEIAFKRNAIIDAGLQFDEEFGLGSTYPTGEEFLFLKDALAKGLKVFFYPSTICIHEVMSSGHNLNSELLRAKGAMIKRAFPMLFPLFNIVFAGRKYQAYKNRFSFLKALQLIFKGSQYLKKYE